MINSDTPATAITHQSLYSILEKDIVFWFLICCLGGSLVFATVAVLCFAKFLIDKRKGFRQRNATDFVSSGVPSSQNTNLRTCDPNLMVRRENILPNTKISNG